MRKLVLTSIDNNDNFYFRHLIPFLISLKRTDYDGEIGVLGYDLSKTKIQRLKENGILVFEAVKKKYKTIYIDRQWQATKIAKDYDYLALYDADIWFPHQNLTVFNEVKNKENLYCAYDPAYGDFLEKCVFPNFQQEICTQINRFLKIHQKPWQVGVIIGHKQAWRDYQSYIEESLKQEEKFTQKYGIDSLLILLYSLEQNRISELPMKYNSIPRCGISYSNLDEKGNILEKWEFQLNYEFVQGIHEVSDIRLRGNFYFNFISRHFFDYIQEGWSYRLDDNYLTDIAGEKLNFITNKKKENSLTVKSLSLESLMNFSTQNKVHRFAIQASSNILLKNETNQTIELNFAIEKLLDFDIPIGCYVIFNKQTVRKIEKMQNWYEIELEPNDELMLITRDLDPNTKMNWVIKGADLVC